MIISLHGRARATFVAGAELTPHPCLALPNLTFVVRPYSTGQEHETHYLRSLGCGDWYPSEFDETLFDPNSRLLSSLAWHVPETRLSDDDPLAPWRDAPLLTGGLALVGPDSFALEPTQGLWYPRDGNVLACLHEMPDRTAERLRIHVARDTELLIADGMLCGWTLRHPAHYIVWPPVSVSQDSEDTELPHYLATYLDIIVEASPEYPEFDHNSRWPHMLNDLITAIDTSRGMTEHRTVIRNAAVDLADFIS